MMISRIPIVLFNYFEKGNNLKHKISISNLSDETNLMKNIKKYFKILTLAFLKIFSQKKNYIYMWNA
jgi:hypothetical protein